LPALGNLRRAPLPTSLPRSYPIANTAPNLSAGRLFQSALHLRCPLQILPDTPVPPPIPFFLSHPSHANKFFLPLSFPSRDSSFTPHIIGYSNTRISPQFLFFIAGCQVSFLGSYLCLFKSPCCRRVVRLDLSMKPPNPPLSVPDLPVYEPSRLFFAALSRLPPPCIRTSVSSSPPAR